MKESLNSDNFDATVFGGTSSSFLKFYAPWCGHCKAMAPAWEQLGDEYASDSSVLIGSVDCSAHSQLCSEHGVEAYPTLKYVQSGEVELQDYEGEMTAEALSSEAKTLLRPACLPSQKEACTDADWKLLHAYLATAPAELTKQLAAQEKPVREAEKKVEDLNEKIEALEEKLEAQEEAVEKLKKENGPKIRLMKAALGLRKDYPKDEP